MARLSDLVRDLSLEPRGGGQTGSREEARSAPGSRGSFGRWYAVARHELRRIGEEIRAGGTPRIDGCGQMAAGLIRELHHSDECLQWALSGETDDYLVDNVLHVAIIAVKIGVGLRYSEEDLEHLALAGLLHDVGMWTLPAALTGKAGSLTAEEQGAVRAHPERGRRILAGLGPAYASVSAIAAQEHERWDGTGYPCRLKGTQILEPAQIIGLADVFDALITARPYKGNISPHKALRELFVHGKQSFSHRVLKSLGDHITLYPVGTAVRLSTGEVGTVSRVNPQSPLRPVLEMPSKGVPGDSDEAALLDLVQTTSVHIVEVLQSARTA